jgi:probable HAF family extracellular repeat protein
MRAIRFLKAVRLVVTVGTLAAALVTLTAPPGVAAPAALQIHDLGTLPGGSFSEANDINNRGWVVGTSGQASGEGLGHAFLWRNGRMLDLGTLGGEFSEALEVNNRGVVVGNSETASGALRPFAWYRGVMRELNVAGINSFATAVNNRGQVTGAATRDPAQEAEAYRWQRGRTTFLGTLPAQFPSSVGRDINDRGQVVGSSMTLSGGAHAVLWRAGRIVDLGTLGGVASSAEGINNRGWVVGESDTGDGPHAFLWRKGQLTDLGTLLGFGFSSAAAVNDRGVIVGRSLSDTGLGHAVIWR